MCDDWKEREVVVVVLFWLVDDAEDGVSFVQYTMTKFEIGFSKKKNDFFFQNRRQTHSRKKLQSLSTIYNQIKF